MLSYRKANHVDCDRLFRWANDPETRRQSFSSYPIKYSEHKNWLKQKLEDPECRILIYYSNKLPVGQTRAEKHAYGIEIDITVSPKMRGKGYGEKMLALLKKNCSKHWRGVSLYAHIKEKNIASKKVFEKAGFVMKSNKKHNRHDYIEMEFVPD